jgi:hypothetical protein
MESNALEVNQIAAIEDAVKKAVPADERVMCVFKPVYTPLGVKEIFFKHLLFDLMLLVTDVDQFSATTYASVGWYSAGIIVIGVALYGLMAFGDVAKACVALAVLLIVIPTYGILHKVASNRAFVITNKRLICWNVKEGREQYWISLDKLNGVEVIQLKKRDPILKLTFSEEPQSSAGKLYRKQIEIRNVQNAQQVKMIAQSVK